MSSNMKVGDKDFSTFKSLKTHHQRAVAPKPCGEGRRHRWKPDLTSGKDAVTKCADVHGAFLIVSFSLISDSNTNKNKRAGVQHTHRTAAQRRRQRRASGPRRGPGSRLHAQRPGVPPGQTEGKVSTAGLKPLPMHGYGKREIKVSKES